MKATIREITKQESGFVKIDDTWYLDNWASDAEEYTCDLRKARKINVLQYLINEGVVEVIDDLSRTWRPDDYYTKYKGRYYRPLYIEQADPVSIADLDVEGTLYYVEDMIIIAPADWN